MTSSITEKAVSDIADVTDFVASGSFASLAENVKYQRDMSYAVLVRLVDFNANWSGDFVYVDEKAYNFLHKSNLEPGDVVIANVGANAGSVFRVPHLQRPMTLGPNAILVRPKNKSSETKRFLYFYFSSPVGQDQIQSIISGSAQPKFNKTDFRRMKVKFPHLDEQRVIANILGSLDDKIELNRQINQTLEQMAQALFQSWFVDFEPVKAKLAALAEGRDSLRAAMSSLSGKTDLELDAMPREQWDALAATAALFPDEMEPSALGEVPQGWEVSTIGQEVSVLGGGTPSTANPAYWNGEYAWATPKDLSRLSDKVLTNTERKITRTGVKNISSGQLPVGTVLLSSRAPIGYLALAMMPVSINQGFIAMQCSGRLPNMYALQWATSNLDAIKQRGSGTTFAEISKSNFRPMPVLVPDKNALTAFQKLTIPLYEQITTNVREAESLATLRDALLPRLLSGELEVVGIGSTEIG